MCIFILKVKLIFAHEHRKWVRHSEEGKNQINKSEKQMNFKNKIFQRIFAGESSKPLSFISQQNAKTVNVFFSVSFTSLS